ncbi:MAG: hypothetical protein JW984_07840 [Deltaproteobacteria bacterium]|uniref:HXXEE domain-containing protein n=1 Tax=Candidatus Zymogenus saltonus TaxID=2844893 RepID=A0A9D8KFI5_9DELT|nr:hypothetical protein [Candidatus Zymogenus saltonus]
MKLNKVNLFYLLLLFFHVGHVLEEAWGGFRVIGIIGIEWFLAVNWLLFSIPVVIFYFILEKRRWAYLLGMIYGAVMTLNGIGHNIVTIVTDRYFGFAAGGFTGIGLILTGIPLVYYLMGEYREIGTAGR